MSNAFDSDYDVQASYLASAFLQGKTDRVWHGKALAFGYSDTPPANATVTVRSVCNAVSTTLLQLPITVKGPHGISIDGLVSDKGGTLFAEVTDSENASIFAYVFISAELI